MFKDPMVSDRGHGRPSESLTTSALHFLHLNTAAVALCTVPASLTGDQQMLISRVNSDGREGGRAAWMFSGQSPEAGAKPGISLVRTGILEASRLNGSP